MNMRRQTLALLLAISGWILWARQPLTQRVAAGTLVATSATPLPPAATPSIELQVEEDWPTYTHPHWGISFRYRPDWEVNGTEFIDIASLTPEQRDYVQTLGHQIYVSPPAATSPRTILIMPEQYTLSPGGSLVEWVILRNEYSEMTGFRTDPLELFSLPAQYMPDGVDQAVYSIDERSYNTVHSAVHVLWLERDEVIYSIRPSYDQPEDIALAFQIAASLDFDPEIEASFREKAKFSGDEEALRQFNESMQPQPQLTPECDIVCRDQRAREEQMQAFEAAVNLPATERPMPQPISPLPREDNWRTYTQPVWGISFHYPPEWSIEDALGVNQQDESAAISTGLALYRDAENNSQQRIMIRLSPYTIGENTPLHNWEAIQDQRYRAMQPNYQIPYRLFVPVDPKYVPRQADDMVHTRIQTSQVQADRVWISKNGLVFNISIDDSTVLPLAIAVISTLEFDTEQLEKLHSLDIFYGDERTLAADMITAWAQPTLTPTPTIDPLAAATPTPTPTPTVRATVTPSAFESPLVNGLKPYQGTSMMYGGMPPYKFGYDLTLWQLASDGQGTQYLVHQEIPGCEINLSWGPFEAYPLAPIELDGYEWGLSYFPMNNVDALNYSLRWVNGSYIFSLRLPTRLPEGYNPDNKSDCQRDAEAVLGTFTIIETTPIATATPARDTLLPTVTPKPN
jgi:hypothetical protein